jgi:hypothetical protein
MLLTDILGRATIRRVVLTTPFAARTWACMCIMYEAVSLHIIYPIGWRHLVYRYTEREDISRTARYSPSSTRESRSYGSPLVRTRSEAPRCDCFLASPVNIIGTKGGERGRGVTEGRTASKETSGGLSVLQPAGGLNPSSCAVSPTSIQPTLPSFLYICESNE